MKKVAVVIVMLALVAGAVWADNGYEFVDDYDGHFWMKLNMDQKLGYLQGFFAAHAAMYERLIYENGGEEEPIVHEYFYIDGCIGELWDDLDVFFVHPNNRGYRIIDAIYILIEKDYWRE